METLCVESSTRSACGKILAPARVNMGVAGRSAPSLSDSKLKKKHPCVTRELGRWATWSFGRLGD